jgi:hypothetical protein
MQLAQGEIMKAETEFGRDVGIWILLVREADVQSDRLGSDIERPTVGGLHHSRPSAGYNRPYVVYERHDSHRPRDGRIHEPPRKNDSWPGFAQHVMLLVRRIAVLHDFQNGL